jgi:hypothetical protein
MKPAEPATNEEHPMPTTNPRPAAQDTSGPEPDPAGGHQMDSRMMWVMMIGCCLAIPLALIVGGAGLAGSAGASPWLIGAGVVLAIALLVVRRRSAGAHCDTPPDRHG